MLLKEAKEILKNNGYMCESKQNEYDPYKINGNEKKVESKNSFEVKLKNHQVEVSVDLKTIKTIGILEFLK